jgi:hypothetical protein
MTSSPRRLLRTARALPGPRAAGRFSSRCPPRGIFSLTGDCQCSCTASHNTSTILRSCGAVGVLGSCHPPAICRPCRFLRQPSAGHCRCPCAENNKTKLASGLDPALLAVLALQTPVLASTLPSNNHPLLIIIHPSGPQIEPYQTPIPTKDTDRGSKR